MFYWNSLFTFQSIEIGKQIEITINGENLEIQSWIKNYYNDIENQQCVNWLIRTFIKGLKDTRIQFYFADKIWLKGEKSRSYGYDFLREEEKCSQV